MDTTKYCYICNKIKIVNEFRKDTSYRNCIGSFCKKCNSNFSKLSYLRKKAGISKKIDHSKSIQCKICNGYYSDDTNLSHHKKTKKHQNTGMEIQQIAFDYLNDLYNCVCA